MTTYVNASKVLRVNLVSSRKSTWFMWKEAVPEKRSFFGWVKRKASPAGWVENGYYDSSVCDEDYMLNRSSRAGTLFVKREDLSLWDKAYVEIESQGGKYTNQDRKYFESDHAAEAFAEEIASMFPHIKIERR